MKATRACLQFKPSHLFCFSETRYTLVLSAACQRCFLRPIEKASFSLSCESDRRASRLNELKQSRFLLCIINGPTNSLLSSPALSWFVLSLCNGQTLAQSCIFVPIIADNAIRSSHRRSVDVSARSRGSLLPLQLPCLLHICSDVTDRRRGGSPWPSAAPCWDPCSLWSQSSSAVASCWHSCALPPSSSTSASWAPSWRWRAIKPAWQAWFPRWVGCPEEEASFPRSWRNL